jgi:hypothetical protein
VMPRRRHGSAVRTAFRIRLVPATIGKRRSISIMNTVKTRSPDFRWIGKEEK